MLYVHKYLTPCSKHIHKITEPEYGDVCLSNIGHYPFQTSHTLPDGRVICVISIHMFSQISRYGPASYFYISSLNAMSFCLAHKYEDEVGEKLYWLTLLRLWKPWEQFNLMKPSIRLLYVYINNLELVTDQFKSWLAK